ncbi:hypothetical protein, partial [Microbacterium aurantiacum]|uniref:hypothetical protein n=1 Tax=Microbacterium aurantiacum TaxID=162393 RepID=UPI001CA56045
ADASDPAPAWRNTVPRRRTSLTPTPHPPTQQPDLREIQALIGGRRDDVMRRGRGAVGLPLDRGSLRE